MGTSARPWSTDTDAECCCFRARSISRAASRDDMVVSRVGVCWCVRVCMWWECGNLLVACFAMRGGWNVECDVGSGIVSRRRELEAKRKLSEEAGSLDADDSKRLECQTPRPEINAV